MMASITFTFRFRSHILARAMVPSLPNKEYEAFIDYSAREECLLFLMLHIDLEACTAQELPTWNLWNHVKNALD